MPKLIHKESKRLIADHVIRAKGLKQRINGLLSYSALKEREVFWLSACPSIHTFFMKFPIDVIFTDRKFYVLSLFENVPARRLLVGQLGSQNVFEMKAGQIKVHQLKKGDCLYVEH